MTIVVTGAAGHVGNNLVRQLLERGERVRVLLYPGDSLHERSLAGLDVERVSGDVRDPACLRELVRAARVVFHLAAVISIDSSTDHLLEPVNVAGTANVVEACLAADVGRLVHASSVHALAAERAGHVPLDESVPLVEAGEALPYDRSKAESERVVLAGVARGLRALIVNPAAVVGPHDYAPSLTAQGLLSMLRTPMAVSGAYNWVDVRDVVAGMISAAERGRIGERYLLSGQRVTIPELFALLAELTGGRAPRATMPRGVLALGAPLVAAYAKLSGSRPLYTAQAVRILHSPCDFRHDKAARELGYSTRPLADTLRDALAFFHTQGLL